MTCSAPWPPGSGACWDRLLFCAKESVYKAWFPLAKRWLDFQDAAITVDPVRRTFTARLAGSGPAGRGGGWAASPAGG